MALLQKAAETFDRYYQFAVQNREGHTMLAPVGHIVTQATLEITLDMEGNFLDGTAVDKKEPKIIIPVTEGSAGRTSAPCAHPLCEQLGYLIPANRKKFLLYVQQLTAWYESEYTHPKLLPVLRYVTGETILLDLERCGLLKCKKNGMPEDDKLLIRWRLRGEDVEECWLDQTLFDAFTAYYVHHHSGVTELCMVSGRETTLAEQHPKGVIAINGNAKLISANDSQGFTYRGRFTAERQALTVGYEVSQKAHNALRWLAQEQKTTMGGVPSFAGVHRGGIYHGLIYLLYVFKSRCSDLVNTMMR